MRGFLHRLILAMFELFTRRPFNILIPVLVGALIGPVLVWIGLDPRASGVLALIVIALLILYLSSAAVRRRVDRVVSALRRSKSRSDLSQES
jgi:hypothetical protein